VSVERLRYRADSDAPALGAALRYAAFADIEALRAALARHGAVLDEQSAAQDGDGVLSRVQLFWQEGEP